MPGPFGLLFGDPLLDQVTGRADGVRRARNRHDAVAGARSKHALLRDLNVGTTEVLNLHE